MIFLLPSNLILKMMKWRRN